MNDKLKAALICGLSLLTLTMSAQKKTFTLDELLSGGDKFYSLRPENMFTAWWGDKLVQLDAEQCRLAGGKKQLLFTLDDVNRLLAAADTNKVRSLYYASFPDARKTQVLLRRKGEQVLVDWKSGKVVWRQRLNADETAADQAAVPGHVAFVRGDNLFVRTADGREMQVTTDGSREIVYGQSVHRNEFGIDKGTFWSPKGSLLAFYRMDQTMVADYPQVDISTRIATLRPDKYPMAGETSHVVRVGVFSPATGSTVYLKTADPVDRYFTNISWSPDERTIYIKELNRDQNCCQLVSYDAATGEKTGVLIEERHPKYVEPQTPIVFLPWDDKKFITQSQRDGYNHLYLYSADGRLIKQLTSGRFVVVSLLGFNRKTRSAIVVSNEKSPLQHNIYAVNIATGRRTLLDDGTGVHEASLSASGGLMVDRWTSPAIARRISLTRTDGTGGQTLLDAREPWDDYEVPEITCGTLKAADGATDLYYRMVKPLHFDASKKYPTIVYVYGGPHARNVMASRHWMARGWEIYMAQKGYLLFILDNRGSSERGLEFENATFRHLGRVEMDDQMRGVDYLKSLPYVDTLRLGVHGWSYGGFMTVNLMLTHPDVFKVGVAGGPVINWALYEVMYGERYMDTPQANPDGYRESNLTLRAGRLKGRLQIINGYNDPVCVPQHTLSFLRACEDAGTQPDYFTYPGDGHNMMGRDMAHLHERITRYFEDHLKPLK